MKNMKKIAQILLLVLSVTLLSACGKEKPLKAVEGDAKIQNEIEEDIESKEQKSEEQNSEEQNSEEENYGKKNTQNTNETMQASESEEELKVAEPISVEELSDKYTDCIDNVVKDCETVDELAFATVDVNNDGIKELLYTESSVNAAGVYVCFYNEGQIITTGPFGCYGGIKYAPKEGKIVSIMDNMDYMKYELFNIDENYETNREQKLEIEPGSNEGSYYYFLDDEEVTELEYSKAFAKLKNMDVRSLDYCDMFMYDWTTADPDIIAQHFVKLLEGDDPSREYRVWDI